MAENIEHPTLRPEPPCTCTIVDERFWFSHYGATEPGSMWEHNPACPEHGDPNAELISEEDQALSEEHDPFGWRFERDDAEWPGAYVEQTGLKTALHGFVELSDHLDDWVIPQMELPSAPLPAFREGSQEILSSPQ